jgi:hypothetical protein
MSPRTADTADNGATFVFIGLVRRPGASAMPEAPASKRTAVVEIERVLLAPPTFADVTGEVTVFFPERAPPDAGERLLFRCVGWIYGSGLALRALATSPAAAADDALRTAPADPAEAFETQELRMRLQGADLVVGGHVSDVRSVPPRSSKPPSEHDPDWHEALVQVESVLKGAAPSGDLVVYFPLSRDVLWARSPEFRAGQRGLWLLRSLSASGLSPEDAEGLAARARQSFVALDPLDFRPISELPRVRALIP